MLPNFRHLRIALAVCVSVTLFAAGSARADASAWDGDKRAAMRLIAAAKHGEGKATVHRAGVEIKLAPGWKTYWRYPGDSGIPPRFDFSNSTNVRSATVRYPAPHRFVDDGGTSIGYKQGVVFPVHIVPADPAKPVTLSLKLEYAVCEKLCVPAEGSAKLDVSGKPVGTDAVFAEGEAQVPKAAKVGASGKFAIRAVKRDGKKVFVDVAVPADETAELFAEGPTGEWALPVPVPVAGAPVGEQRFEFELDGLPPNTQPEGATLLLTAVTPGGAIEAPYRLDSVK
jgi:DsbC/DsbD-like thiol-disulfide interchange protein